MTRSRALRDTVPDVPERLDRIVAKAMAKRPEDRFESAAALAAALGHAFDPDPPPAAETELDGTVLESTGSPRRNRRPPS